MPYVPYRADKPMSQPHMGMGVTLTDTKHESLPSSDPLESYNPFSDDHQDASVAIDYGLESVTRSGPSKERWRQTSNWALNAPRIAAQNAFAKSRQRYSVQKPRERSGQTQKRQRSVLGRPKIFVNTNVSKRPVRALHTQSPPRRPPSGPYEPQEDEARFATLANLKALGRNGSVRRALECNNLPAFPRLQGSMVATHHPGVPGYHPHRRADVALDSPAAEVQALSATRSEPWTGLSPNDRAVLIGFSFSQGEALERSQNGESPFSDVPSQPHGQKFGKLAETDSTTPAILITPAKEAMGFPLIPMAQEKSMPARIASSVYSRSLSDTTDVSPKPIPPLPVVPPGLVSRSQQGSPLSTKLVKKRESTATVFEEDSSPQARSRGMSTYTTFEEDDTPMSILCAGLSPRGSPATSPFYERYASAESRRHDSNGWWNYIITPFLTGSSTMAPWRASADQHLAELPSPAQAAAAIQAHDAKSDKLWERLFSPTSPPFSKPKQGHLTTWGDISRWQEGVKAAEPTNPFVDDDPFVATAEMKSEHSNSVGFNACHTEEPQDTNLGAGLAVPKAAHISPSQQHHSQRLPVSSCQTPSDIDPQSAQSDLLSPAEKEISVVLDNPSSHVSGTGTIWPTAIFSPEIPQSRPKLSKWRSDNHIAKAEVGAQPTVHGAHFTSVLQPGPPSISKGSPLPDEDKADMESLPRVSNPPPYSPPRTRLQPAAQRQYVPSSLSTGRTPVIHSRSVQHPGIGRAMSSRAMPPGSGAAGTPGGVSRNLGRNSPGHSGPESSLPVPNRFHVTLNDIEDRSQKVRKNEAKRQRGEKEDAIAKRTGSLWRGRGCFSATGCFNRKGAEARKRRRWYCVLGTAFAILLVLTVVLATVLSRKRTPPPLQPSIWANLTGWPPVPTGLTSVVQPDLVRENSGCVFPSTMWSCALPKELQESNMPSYSSQPNFQFHIELMSNNITDQATTKARLSSTGKALPFPSPDPPSIEDQRFMGNTTDEVESSLPEGEESPFLISLVNAPLPSPKLLKRQSARSDPFPNIVSSIPEPEIEDDGTAKAANLLPFPSFQPMRLYDRDLDTEHYGFYTYFDRSIFLKSASLLSQSDIGRGEVPADLDGGSTKEEAQVRCTWAQTRFLIRIWTRRAGATLLESSSSSNSTKESDPRSFSTPTPSTTSSRPGSFPYPITISLDRHGGDVSKKMIYLYGIDSRARILSNSRKIQVENRGFGGKLVGGGQGPLGKDRVSLAQGGLGGIDGGTGGCACEWKNFFDQPAD